MLMLEKDWCFGPRDTGSPKEKEFWDRHAPVVRAWIEEGLAEGTIEHADEAEHAAFCLVSNRVFEWRDGAELGWEGFDLDRFLWDDLVSGGSVGLYEPRRFFRHTMTILERFGLAGLLGEQDWRGWIEGLRAREEELVRFFGDEMSDEEMEEVASRYLGTPEVHVFAPPLEAARPAPAPEAPSRRKPSRSERRAKRAKRKAQRAARRGSR